MMLTETSRKITFLNLRNEHKSYSIYIVCQYEYFLSEGVYFLIFSATSVSRRVEFICKNKSNIFQNSTVIAVSSLPF